MSLVNRRTVIVPRRPVPLSTRVSAPNIRPRCSSTGTTRSSAALAGDDQRWCGHASAVGDDVGVEQSRARAAIRSNDSGARESGRGFASAQTSTDRLAIGKRGGEFRSQPERRFREKQRSEEPRPSRVHVVTWSQMPAWTRRRGHDERGRPLGVNGRESSCHEHRRTRCRRQSPDRLVGVEQGNDPLSLVVDGVEIGGVDSDDSSSENVTTRKYRRERVDGRAHVFPAPLKPGTRTSVGRRLGYVPPASSASVLPVLSVCWIRSSVFRSPHSLRNASRSRSSRYCSETVVWCASDPPARIPASVRPISAS